MKERNTQVQLCTANRTICVPIFIDTIRSTFTKPSQLHVVIATVENLRWQFYSKQECTMHACEEGIKARNM